jgi:membrane protein YdbS with pleckstrin-like domain
LIKYFPKSLNNTKDIKDFRIIIISQIGVDHLSDEESINWDEDTDDEISWGDTISNGSNVESESHTDDGMVSWGHTIPQQNVTRDIAIQESIPLPQTQYESNPNPSSMILGEGESVIFYKRKHFGSLLGSIISGIILVFFGITLAIASPIGVLLIFIGLIPLVGAFLEMIKTEYVITNKRVYAKTGLLSRKATDASFDKITDASISQSFSGRLFGYGDVRINTAGTQTYEIIFKGVPNPMLVRSKIKSVSENYEKSTRINERIERLEDRYLTGEISKTQYEEAKRRLERRM